MGFVSLSPSVWLYRDVCNVYVVTEGPRALLIDVGTGAVLDDLHEIGVEKVEWILHTHHHRDQCEGDARVAALGARIAVPDSEASYFEDAEGLWQRQRLFDLYDCTNVFNRPARSVPVDHRIADYEHFRWNRVELLAQPTPGHTKGSLTYLVEVDGLRYAFCGDLLHAAGRVWTLHDLHWDYSNPDGLDATIHSAHGLRRERLDRLAPAHGEVMKDADGALAALDTNLRRLHVLTGQRFLSDLAPPIAVEHRFREVTEHLIAVTQSSANFYVLKADDGRALLFDYGFPSFYHMVSISWRFVEHSLAELAERYGVEHIEVVVPTHYHDDHVCGVPFLQRRFGAQVWVFEKLVDVLARPSAHHLPALWSEPIHGDRIYGDGEIVAWDRYRFEARHLPGHTRYAVALFGEVDGRRIAVTGDEIQLDANGRLRGGGPVYRNGFASTDFTTGVRTVLAYEPEVLLTGHDGPLEVTRADLEGVERWSLELEESLRALAPSPEAVELALDPGIISIDPYQANGRAGKPVELDIVVRNPGPEATSWRIRPIPPAGWSAEPSVREAQVNPGETARLPVRLHTPPSAAIGVRNVILIDAELSCRKLGQVAESLVTLEP
jgi:glyoxylase-like metal-dependent hydrolase (beta-lactamase superfamily II)